MLSREVDSSATRSSVSPIAAGIPPVRSPQHLHPAPDSPSVPVDTALGDDVDEGHLIRGYD